MNESADSDITDDGGPQADGGRCCTQTSARTHPGPARDNRRFGAKLQTRTKPGKRCAPARVAASCIASTRDKRRGWSKRERRRPWGSVAPGRIPGSDLTRFR